MTRWLWVAADGSTTDLSDWSAGTYVLDDGTSGELAPEYEFASQTFAGVDGETLQQISVGSRSTTLGMDLVASDGEELRARVRRLAHVLRPRAGIGTLRAVNEDGSVRSLPCYYRKGLDAGTYRVSRYRCALEFWAPSPWWLGSAFTDGYTLSAGRAFFPIFPLTLSATTIAGAATVDLSDTDAPTYPQWTITGPGDQLTLRNDTTGAALVLNAAIGDGQLVFIDTRPGRQSVQRAAPGVPTWTEIRRQLVPNPELAAQTLSWFATTGTGGTSTAARVASGWPVGGGTFYRQTYTVASTNAAGTGSIAALVADGRASAALPIPVTAGLLYAAAIDVRTSVAQLVQCRIQWYDAANTAIAVDGQALGGPVVTVPDTVVRATVEGIVAPVGAAYARVAAYTPNGTGAVPFPIGATFDASRAQLERATYVGQTVGDYFTGSTPDVGTGIRVGDVRYDWTGATDGSPSTLSQVTAVAAPVLGANLFGSLSTDPALWPLLDGVNAVSVLLTNAGPSSRIDLAADRLYSGAR